MLRIRVSICQIDRIHKKYICCLDFMYNISVFILFRKEKKNRSSIQLLLVQGNFIHSYKLVNCNYSVGIILGYYCVLSV